MNAKKMDIERRIDRAQERYARHWEVLGEEERQLANKVVCLTEYVGGRQSAADLIGVGATTIDNYRMGSTQPKYLEVLKLVQAAGLDINYLFLGSEFWALAHPPVDATKDVESHVPSSDNETIDERYLAEAIGLVEDWLETEGRSMLPKKKADVVTQIYQFIIHDAVEGERPFDRNQVQRILRLVA